MYPTLEFRANTSSTIMILKKLLRKKNSADILKPDLIIVGLGNPEPHYARTRHNAGWWLIDLLAEKHGIEVGRAHSTTRLGVGTIGEYTVALAKPRTHVNGSGTAVRYLLARFRTTQDRLLIVYDETALPPGKLRLRPKGSAAGHNGIKSIIETLGNQDFARLRIGVGRPPPGDDMIGWVLGEMSAQDQDLVDEAIVRAGDSILYLMDDGVDVAMNKVN